jgi:hypothetical protein
MNHPHSTAEMIYPLPFEVDQLDSHIIEMDYLLGDGEYVLASPAMETDHWAAIRLTFEVEDSGDLIGYTWLDADTTS